MLYYYCFLIVVDLNNYYGFHFCLFICTFSFRTPLYFVVCILVCSLLNGENVVNDLPVDYYGQGCALYADLGYLYNGRFGVWVLCLKSTFMLYSDTMLNFTTF
jgi:hypothetical protein